MPTLPWTQADTSASDVAGSAVPAGPAADDVVVLGSRLELRSYRTIPSFLRAALDVRTQVRRSPGAVGVSLVAQPTRRTFWTLSAWDDREALETFVQTLPHRDVMGRFHDAMAGSEFATWTMRRSELPRPRSNAKPLWTEARARLAVAAPGEV